ncbi:MAG: D-alanyl-D-alanine carboxypeptidase family protein [Acidobacteria bacterium]|nr:D-alanyl-D-alanine carboxypeptidase family protein [Acidobacteriota bacterium]
MKQKKTHLAVFAVALAALVGVLMLVSRTGYGQTQADSKAASTPALQPLALVEKRTAVAAAEKQETSLFADAAARNTVLKYELSWAFGGKQQRGWYLYTPLISRLLEMDGEAAGPDFASALSRWQTTAGLHPSGVLDDETLYRMVSAWQGSRLKNKVYATPDMLLQAPSADFYDPARPDELRQVERETYAAYKRMVAAAAADPSLGLKVTAAGELAPEEKFFKIVSSFRSREHQAALRAQSPDSGRAGLAVNSPHFTGRALDLYVGGEPVETKDSNRALQVQTPAYRWLVRNAERFGFRPYYYEPWHWEYVGVGTAENK